MARQLVIIRHAKSADGPVDVERPLAPRGLRDAPMIGQWLSDHELTPTRVVVSPARRARETWDGAATKLDAPPPVIDERIYSNDVDALLAVLHDTPDEVETLAIVGHNPSFGDLAAALDDGSGDPEALRELISGFATSAVAVYEVPGTWADVRLGGARLTHAGTPRG